MYVGQELTCTGRANPSIDSAQWFRDEALPDQTDLTLVVPSEWLGQNITLSCLAYNDIGSAMSPEVSFTVARKLAEYLDEVFIRIIRHRGTTVVKLGDSKMLVFRVMHNSDSLLSKSLRNIDI